MSISETLSQRLRKRRPHWNIVDAKNMAEAAALIESQAAQIAALTAAKEAMLIALDEIAWSNDSAWQSARADAAISAARTQAHKDGQPTRGQP